MNESPEEQARRLVEEQREREVNAHVVAVLCEYMRTRFDLRGDQARLIAECGQLLAKLERTEATVARLTNVVVRARDHLTNPHLCGEQPWAKQIVTVIDAALAATEEK